MSPASNSTIIALEKLKASVKRFPLHTGHDVALLNPFQARRFRTPACNAPRPRASTPLDSHDWLEKRPAPTHLHDEAAEVLRELVRHRDRLRQDFDDRVRQLHRLVDRIRPVMAACRI